MAATFCPELFPLSTELAVEKASSYFFAAGCTVACVVVVLQWSMEKACPDALDVEIPWLRSLTIFTLALLFFGCALVMVRQRRSILHQAPDGTYFSNEKHPVSLSEPQVRGVARGNIRRNLSSFGWPLWIVLVGLHESRHKE